MIQGSGGKFGKHFFLMGPPNVHIFLTFIDPMLTSFKDPVYPFFVLSVSVLGEIWTKIHSSVSRIIRVSIGHL